MKPKTSTRLHRAAAKAFDGLRATVGMPPRRHAHQSFATSVTRVAARTARKLSENAPSELFGEQVHPDAFGQVGGLLPVVCWHANAIANTVSERFALSPIISPDPDTLVGARVSFIEHPAFAASSCLFIQEAMHHAWEELPKNEHGLVILDDLVLLFQIEHGLQHAARHNITVGLQMEGAR